MASAVAATNKWLLTKRSQCGTESLWDNKLWRERRVRDFHRSLHRTKHKVWDVRTTRAPLLCCKEGVPFKSDKRKEAEDTRRREVSELRRVHQASSVLSAFICRMNVECRMHDMFDSHTECAVRQLHGTELSYDAPQLKECSGLQSRIFYSRVYFCLFVCLLLRWMKILGSLQCESFYWRGLGEGQSYKI